MAVDSSIPLGVRQIELPNQLAQFAQAQQIQGMQQRNRLVDLQFQQAERENAEKMAIGDAYRQNIGADGTVNRQGLIGNLAQNGAGASIPALNKQFAEQDKSAREAEKARLEQAGQQISLIGQIAGSANDPQSYAAGRARLQAAGVDVSQIPEQYDPQYVASARQQALTAAQQLEQTWKQKGFDLDQQKFGYQQQNDQANRGVQIRGQDLSASTAMRGQDITARGQNMVDARSREANATGKAPSGYRWTADGTALEPIPGGPGIKDKAPTEFQGKSATYGSRADAADRIISSLEGQYSPAAINSKEAASNIPVIGGALGTAANTMLSPTSQRAEQAQRDFINAVLRQESGAAIGESEFTNARRQYFPQPGDSPEVMQQKAANRRLAVQGFQNNAGPAARPPAAIPAAPSSTSSGRINGGATNAGASGGWSVRRLD